MMNARLEELRSKFQENPRRYFAPFANELRKAGDPAQAIQVCRAHLASQPGHVSGHIVLGQALYEAGENNEARDIFMAALELDPENLIALRSLGEIAQVNGDFDAARQWYERLLDADPRNNDVSQLLRDLPAAAAPAEPAGSTPVSAGDEEEADRLPFNARPDSTAPEPIPAPPIPTFHTSFTGSSPVIKPEPSLEPPQETAKAEALDIAEEPEVAPAESESEAEPVSASAPAAPAIVPDEAIEMIDFDAFESQAPEPEPVAPSSSMPDESVDSAGTVAASSSMPDESVDSAGTVAASSSMPDESFDRFASSSVPDESLDRPGSASVPDESYDAREGYHDLDAEPITNEAIAGAFGAGDSPPAQAEAPEEPAAPTPSAEPPRAIFAEFGFDGPVDDQLGWMTTPSAALSDLESAPEDWFDESSTASLENEEAREEAPAAELAPDHATDSWFDDVAGAAAIEATEVSNDDFWLPPDLNRVPSAEEPSEPEPASPLGKDLATSYEAELAAAAESPTGQFASVSHDEADEAPMAAAESREDHVEPYAFAQEEAPDAAEDAAIADHSTEMPLASYWAEPVSAEEPSKEEEPVEARTESPWSEPAVPEPSAFAEAEPVERAEPSWMAPAAAAHEVVSEPEPVEAPVASTWSEPAAEEQQQHVESEEPEPVEAAHEESPREEMYTPTPSLSEASPPVGVVMGLTPASVEAIPPTPPAPFVTETLAELYLQQGFRDEALSIYRQLVDRDPGNASIRDRLDAIERGQSAELGVLAEAPVENRAASQSVRSFFSRLARRPAVTPPRESAPSEDPGRGNPDVPFAAAASALANLFAASKPPASDEGAASTLASAFTDPAGRPSRAADRELSLDHLFRDVPPGGSASGGVSLDEFYATPDATPGSPTEPGEAAEPGEPSGTDIRQFTAWLEGLRKK